jgi:hypothetical protein
MIFTLLTSRHIALFEKIVVYLNHFLCFVGGGTGKVWDKRGSSIQTLRSPINMIQSINVYIGL